MDAREFEGKTIDEAIDRACIAFGVPRDKLHIDILSEGAPGFLGLGAKKALVRAGLMQIDLTIDPTGPKGAVKAPGPCPPCAGPAPLAPRPEQRESPSPAGPSALPLSAEPPPSGTGGEAIDGETPAGKAKRILEGLLGHMQIEAAVETQETPEAVTLNILGDGNGLVIGKRGQNLDALQYLVNKAVHHSTNGHKMIVVDTEGYRKRREEALIALALRVGQKVKKTRKPLAVGHMNAHDRRLIHLALQNDASLATRSRGEGEYRSLVILPARRGPENDEG